jgi:hypothetical protein
MSSKENKNFKIENHIGIYDGFILDSECDKAIKMFEDRVKFKQTFNRMQCERAGVHLKNDEATDFYYDLDIWQHDLKNIVTNFDMCLKNYEVHTSIKDYMGIENFEFTCFKIQKTLPTQGYHLWHVERAPGFDNYRRGLAYTIYLNDIEEGGETEFLNQSVRVKPKKGRVVIWPAGFPYVHRGNPPLKDTNYILTSWMLIPSS